MAMEVDIVVRGSGDLGPHRHLDAFAAFQPARFLAGHIALVKGDLAAMADGDIDLAALGLGPAFVLPGVEVLARLKDNDLAPSCLAIGIGPFLDGGALRGPELPGIGEVTLLAEQVGDDWTVERGEVE